MSKIFVSGSRGFIGSHLLPRLLKAGHEVDEYNTDSNIKRFLDKEYDCVIHLAGITEYHEINNNPDGFREKTINLLQKVMQIKTKKFIFPSSGKVYGGNTGLIEEIPPTPTTDLGKVKLACENIVGCRKGENFILRLFNVYGEGQKDSFVIPTIINQIKTGTVVKLGDIKSGRDYIYIEDVINLLLKVVNTERTEGNYVYNVATGDSVTVREITEYIAETLKKQVEIVVEKDKIRHESWNESGNSYKAAIDFDWKILYNIKDGLNDLLKKEHLL